jgi:molybdopterin converting factor small subunit
MIRVVVPTHLRSYTNGRPEVEASGATLGAVLGDLDAHYPGLRFRIVDEQDHVRTHIKFFVGADLAPGLDHPVRDGDDVTIIAALSGG